MWYNVDPNGLKWNELLDLYKIVESREKAFRDDLFRFTNFYSAVCYAILAVTLSGLMSLLDKGIYLLFLLIGPMLAFFMCFLGLRLTSRIYRRIIEEISIKAKLENALGFDKPVSIVQFLGTTPIWPEDETLLHSRHAKRRYENKNSKDFIESAAKHGFYRDNRMYFALIALFAGLLSVAILFLGFFPMKQ